MLTVHEGELVEVMDISRNEWCLVQPSSRQSVEGWVPTAYLRPYDSGGCGKMTIWLYIYNIVHMYNVIVRYIYGSIVSTCCIYIYIYKCICRKSWTYSVQHVNYCTSTCMLILVHVHVHVLHVIVH